MTFGPGGTWVKKCQNHDSMWGTTASRNFIDKRYINNAYKMLAVIYTKEKFTCCVCGGDFKVTVPATKPASSQTQPH